MMLEFHPAANLFPLMEGAEFDALEPTILAGLVTDWVLEHRDEGLYLAAKKKQDDWKAELRELAKKFKEG
jgi:hypothetical protein